MEKKTQMAGNGSATLPITWEWKAKHILTDKFVLRDMLKVIGFSGGGLMVILLSIMLFQRDWDALRRVFLLCLLVIGIFAVLALVVMLLFGGIFRYRYTIDEASVDFEMISKKARKASSLAILLGALLGSAGTVGAGLLAKSEQRNRIKLNELKWVLYYPKDSAIKIRGKGNPKPILLYCPPGRYEEIEAVIRNGQEASGAA